LVISAAPAPTGAENAFPGRVMNDDRWLGEVVASSVMVTGRKVRWHCMKATLDKRLSICRTSSSTWLLLQPKFHSLFFKDHAELELSMDEIIRMKEKLVLTVTHLLNFLNNDTQNERKFSFC